MDCVCPYCGKKILAGRIGFDFTDYISKQLEMAMGFPGVVTDQEKVSKESIKGGLQAVFGKLPIEERLVFSEEEIWNLPVISESPSRTVMMNMPFDRLIGLFDVHRKKEGFAKQNIEDSYQWLTRNSQILFSMCFPLILEKEGNGDIRFNLIRTTLDDRPILRKRVCPVCGNNLSFWSGRYREICLGVLGGPRVSKTTTLTACAYAFMKNGGYEGISWQGSRKDQEYIDFEELYLKRYKAGLPIKATKTTENVPRVSFRVTIADRKTGTPLEILTLTFVDLPGELNNQNGIDGEFFHRYSHYFQNVDYIWYCTDPGELQQLQGSAEKNEAVRKLGYDLDKTVLSLDAIRDNMIGVSKIFERNGKSIPVALILGKTDFCSNDDMRQYHLYARKPGSWHRIATNPFDVRYFNDEAVRVRAYMARMNSGLVASFEENFKNHCYIALSAYGYAPTDYDEDEKRSYAPLMPFNVTAPFMWMLVLESSIPLTKMAYRRGKYTQMTHYLRLASKEESRRDYYNLFVRGPYLD